MNCRLDPGRRASKPLHSERRALLGRVGDERTVCRAILGAPAKTWLVAALIAILQFFPPQASAQAADPSRPTSKEEKLGYALGVDVGRGFRERRTPIDPAAFVRGFIDGIERNRTALNPKELEAVKREFDEEVTRRRRAAREERMKHFREASVKNLEAAETFLEVNRTNPGVKQLESGLQYKVLMEGSGAKPKPDSRVRLHYRGMNSEGLEFESTRNGDRGPLDASLDNVLKGWREALLLMNEGSKWKIYVPPHLGHGERGNPPVIGPNVLLIFELELLEVK